MKNQIVSSRMKQLSPRRSATVAALDVGSSKIACLIARLTPERDAAPEDWRTHRARVLGIGHQRSRGVKNGLIVDMNEAESAIRQTVDAAERMAGVQIDRVVVTASGGRLASKHFTAKTAIGGREVAESDVHRVLEASAMHPTTRGRFVMHSLPTGYSLDGVAGVREPKNMVGEELGVDLHVATCDQAATRNLFLAVERGHLAVEAIAAAPYVAGLSVLEPDEAEMGVVVIDMGAGSTSLAVFSGGALVHVDAVMLGGNHVTMDIARGLNARVSDAERLKTMHGAAIASPSDDRETVAYGHVGEGDHHPAQVPKSHVVRIIRPRVEETLEFLRDRLAQAGFGAGRRASRGADRRRLSAHRRSRSRAPRSWRAGAGRTSARRRRLAAGSGVQPGLRRRRGSVCLPAGGGSRVFRAASRAKPRIIVSASAAPAATPSTT
jgi:cell division protein FtsA